MLAWAVAQARASDPEETRQRIVESFPDATATPSQPWSTPTDDGNALRLIAKHGHEFRRVADMGHWYRWNGKRWERDYEGRAIRESQRELARRLPEETTGAVVLQAQVNEFGGEVAVRVAETDPESLDARGVDAHPELLNTPSGAANLRTGAITEHDPALLPTRITSHNVDLDAPPEMGQIPGRDICR